MGVGTPSDILGAVKRGIDMFDCVMPTRSGRTGLAFTWQGKLNLKNSKFSSDNSPLDQKCDIRDLNKYSKGYLNHLIKSDEMLASMIISLNNIYFYQQFMREIQKSIHNGTFQLFYKKYINKNFHINPRVKENFTSYTNTENSKIIIGMVSTLLRENLGAGKKILSCNFKRRFLVLISNKMRLS